MQPVRGRPRGGMLARSLELFTVLDQLDAERANRRVLLARVAVRHDDGRVEPVPPRRKPDRLAVVAARCRDHATQRQLAAPQLVEMDQSAAQLEGAEALLEKRQRCCGVGGTTSRTRRRAASMDSRVYIVRFPG